MRSIFSKIIKIHKKKNKNILIVKAALYRKNRKNAVLCDFV